MFIFPNFFGLIISNGLIKKASLYKKRARFALDSYVRKENRIQALQSWPWLSTKYIQAEERGCLSLKPYWLDKCWRHGRCRQVQKRRDKAAHRARVFCYPNRQTPEYKKKGGILAISDYKHKLQGLHQRRTLHCNILWITNKTIFFFFTTSQKNTALSLLNISLIQKHKIWKPVAVTCSYRV